MNQVIHIDGKPFAVGDRVVISGTGSKSLDGLSGHILEIKVTEVAARLTIEFVNKEVATIFAEDVYNMTRGNQA